MSSHQNSTSTSKSIIPVWVYLSLILLLALFLRLAGIWRTEPIDYHPDEWAVAKPIWYIANNAQSGIKTHYHWPGCGVIYPFGYSLYLLRSFFGPYSYNCILMILRITSALASTATVLVTFLLMRKLASVRAALLTAGLVAVAKLLVLLAHYGTLNSILSLTVLIIMWLSYDLFKIEHTENRSTLKIGTCCIVGLLCGWGIATKWPILLAAVPITIAGLLSLWSHRKLALWRQFIKINLQRIGIIAGMTTLSFLAFLPDLQFAPKEVIGGFTYEVKHHQTGHYGSVVKGQGVWSKRLGRTFSTMKSCGNVYLLYAGLAALVFVLIKPSQSKIFLLLVLFLWLFVVFRNVVAVSRHHVMPFIFMLMLIGFFFDGILATNRIWLRITAGIVYLVLIVMAVLYTCINISPFWKPDARIQCANWIKENVPLGSGVTWAPRTYSWMVPGQLIAPELFKTYPRKPQPGKYLYVIAANRRMRTFKKHPPTRKIVPSEWFPTKPPTMTELILYDEMNNDGGPNLTLVKKFYTRPSFLGLDSRLFGMEQIRDTTCANQAVTLFRINTPDRK